MQLQKQWPLFECSNILKSRFFVNGKLLMLTDNSLESCYNYCNKNTRGKGCVAYEKTYICYEN